jgi:septal ring factor EnvC (AmiA/AmiB activator)
MTQLEIQLKRVHEKIGLLLKQHLALQKENEKLREDLKKMLKRCEDLGREAEKSRQHAEVSMLSDRGLDDSDKKMLEKRLNLYVREIDKCIALLQE